MTTGEKVLLTLPHHFDNLLTNIEPPANRREVAQRIPKKVRDFLKEATDFATITPHSRLTGSYDRHTAIHSIKDVDFLVFVPFDDAGEEPEPPEVLAALERTLRDLPEELGYSGLPELRRQRRSIHVAFTGEDFHLDVVPALIPDGIDEPLRVPDREWGKWVPSHPLGYAKALSGLNKSTGGKAVPLIKLFKHWRTIQMKRRRPKSYYLEALTYRHLDKGWVTITGKSNAELFTDLLCSIHDRFLPQLDEGRVPSIPDPLLGHNVAFNWERAAFEAFMVRLAESIRWAERALAKDREEIDDAITLWQKVFGPEYFTDSANTRMLQKAEWMKMGSVFVTGSGHVSAVRPVSERAVESPRHRFYGDVG